MERVRGVMESGMGAGEQFGLQAKKLAVSTSSIENGGDGLGMNMRLEKFVGLLRRLIWLSTLTVRCTTITITIHDPSTRMKMCIWKHSAT